MAAAAVLVGAALAAPGPAAQAAEPIGGGRLGSGSIVVGTGERVAELPRIGAKTWVLADAETGQVLAARAPHSRRAPASTLKALTALTLIPRLDPDERYRATADDIRVDGSKVGLLVGEEYTHDELFLALFLPSANDAALALARSNGGLDVTLEQMTQEAQRLQALDTVPRSPNGLDEDGQRSSAYDLALIAREGLADEAFARYARTTTAEFPGRSYSGDRRATYQIQTQNPLLLRGYDGALGVKTGFTTQAGRTFIGAAERDGRTLIVTMMGIGERTGDAASRLLDWGFANAERIDRPVGELVAPVAERSNAAPPDSDADEAGDSSAIGGGPVSVEGDDAVAAAGESAGATGPSRLAQGLTGLAVILGLVLITAAVLSSEPVVRRRIRRRYR